MDVLSTNEDDQNEDDEHESDPVRTRRNRHITCEGDVIRELEGYYDY